MSWIKIEDGSDSTPLQPVQPKLYTLAEINVLARNFVNDNDASGDLNSPDALKFRLFMGMFLSYLKRWEKEGGR